MDFLADYGLYFAKTLTAVIAILAVLLFAFALTQKDKLKKGELRITKLNDKFQGIAKLFKHTVLTKSEFKAWMKSEKKADKERKKAKDTPPRIFVIHFKGDMRASQVQNLREEITATLTIATPRDEVVICLESPGGMAHAYGLAASQLQRLRDHNIPLTVAVDKVAASGGYMMACVANRILAAPFSIIGSVGVLAQIPNFHRYLKKHDIDFEQITAGEYKRTLSMFAENTKAGKQKFTEKIEALHTLFKNFVAQHRPEVDLKEIATGDAWQGIEALDLKLVDELITSDDYLYKASQTKDLYRVEYTNKRTIGDKLSHTLQSSIKTMVDCLHEWPYLL